MLNREDAMKIIEITAENKDQACRIISESWKTAYRGIVPQDYLDALGPDRWEPILRDFQGTAFLLEDAETPIATASISAARDDKMSGWGEVISLYVRPDSFRRGYGAALLAHAVGELRRQRFSPIYLWVLEENRAARAFYEHNGFRPNGDQMVIYIGDKSLNELRYVYENPEGVSMTKKLSEMSNEELWQLFPIILSDHRECWPKWYEEESILLRRALPQDRTVRISHVGSTAIPGICAKPIIDLLIEIEPTSDMNDSKELFLQNGYRVMSEEPQRISFNKGYTEKGFAEKVFHLHLRFSGDNDELYFRDYLRDHAEAARRYEKLKIGLHDQYKHNRDNYTKAKTDVIVEYTQKAKIEYGDRYGRAALEPDKFFIIMGEAEK